MAASPPTDRRLAAVTPETLLAMAAAAGGEAPRLAAGPGIPCRDTTAQAGIADGWLALLPGSRIPPAISAGDLTVWTAEGGRLARTASVDRLTALGRPRTWLTQPGDVILGPGPCAVVDTDGGSLVAAPARALRLTADARSSIRTEVAAVIAAATAAGSPPSSAPVTLPTMTSSTTTPGTAASAALTRRTQA